MTQSGLEPKNKGLNPYDLSAGQCFQMVGLWLPSLDTFRTFATPVSPLIEPLVAHCFECDPCELLARVHDRHPVGTPLELAKGAQGNFRMARYPAAIPGRPATTLSVSTRTLISWVFGRFGLKDRVVMVLGDQLADIVFGSIFLFIGLASCSIAAIRGAGGARTLLWLGIWSAMYGSVHVSNSPAVVAAWPRWLQISVPYANTAMTYLLVVFGSLSFVELSLGKLRFLIQLAASVGLAIAVAGTALFALAGSTGKLMLLNNLLAVCLLVVLTSVVTAPRLAGRYLALPGRGVLAIGTFAFTIEALYSSVARNLGLKSLRILDHFGFAVLLFSFGYVALRRVFANERRLLSIENELAIAREIQTSILPSTIPEVENLRISAAYRPMTAVAGDFYEFIPVDQKRIGVLVADVSGHGVPAALIASMIKVAVQSVIPCAHEPGSVLRSLNHLLSGLLRGQFVSAAYLWLDTEKRSAAYAAAGHPPLLLWRHNKLERIESNGLLFGVMRERDDYPVCAMQIYPGDRFLLYTDGVTEPENAAGDSFGDFRLEQAVRDNQFRPPSELSDQLLSEIYHWQPASITQQDDITLLVIDVL
jgi:phosphoserine phosphatase RsbU/P